MPSILQQYMQNYSPRLQSALQSAAPTDAAPVTSTTSVVGQGAQTSALQTAPAGAGLVTEQDAPSAEQPASALQPSQASDQQQPKDGLSFGDAWKQLPEKDRAQQLDQLEQTLQKGNQTIDTAYDDMAAKLGTRPGDKLTREDKGMLLMQFGLSLMQASGSNAYGEDIGAAIGAAGSQTIQSYQGMKSQKRADQDAFDKSQLAIENQRAKAKSDLSAKGAEERTKLTSALIAADEKAQAKKDDQETIAGTLDTENGVYSYNKNGKVSALVDPTTGKPLKKKSTTSEPLVAVLDDNGDTVMLPRSQAAGMKKPPSASQTGKPFAVTNADESSMLRYAQGLFKDDYGYLDETTQKSSAKVARRAVQLYKEAKGGLTRQDAVQMAYDEASGSTSNAEPKATPAAAPDGSPPANLLKRGVVTKFKNGQSWTLDSSGNPKQVK